MRRVVPVVAAVGVFLMVGMGASSCSGNQQQKLAGQNYNKEQAEQQAALREQIKVTPAEFPQFSDERSNINERNIRLNDPNKITYLYLLSRAGTVVMHDVAKGKVSSCSSQILPEEGPVRYRGDDLVVPQPEPDGSFGTNGDWHLLVHDAGCVQGVARGLPDERPADPGQQPGQPCRGDAGEDHRVRPCQDRERRREVRADEVTPEAFTPA